jgi:hypothetical protein
LPVKATLSRFKTLPLDGWTFSSSGGDKSRAVIDADSVLFLDCDTLVFDDPTNLFTGPRFRARSGNANIDDEAWRDLFRTYDKPTFNFMPNAGVLIFDDGLHNEIAEEWQKYLNMDLPQVHENYHKEQLALALALSGYDADELSQNEHVFEWMDESPTTGTVYHLDTDKRVGLRKELEIKYHAVISSIC